MEISTVPPRRSHPLSPPREHRLLYWVGVASAFLVPLTTWLERSLPLHWRGIGLVNTAFSLGKASLHLIFFAALLLGLLVLLPALVRTLGRKKPAEGIALLLPILLQILALLILPRIPVRTGFAANRQAYQEAIALIARRTLPPEGEEIPLPSHLQRLSMTGTVLATRKDGILKAFFLIGEFPGQYQEWLVYSDAERALRPEDLIAGTGLTVKIFHLEGRWYRAYFLRGTPKGDE
ncbi:MAG: hypothetical protein GX493_12320 [Firmicutes bacterium]|nr:hypothetical protein [Bacillota bacterium]